MGPPMKHVPYQSKCNIHFKNLWLSTDKWGDYILLNSSRIHIFPNCYACISTCTSDPLFEGHCVLDKT